MKRTRPTPWTPRRLREALGFEVRAWARVLGVSVKTVDRWETGATMPEGITAEVFRGLVGALEGGIDAADVHRHLALGLGAYIASSAGVPIDDYLTTEGKR